VTVEHVHVHSGGQAIVGNVETKSSGPCAPEAKQLAHDPGVPMTTIDGPGETQPAKSRAKKNKKA
jgi:hypothetical protein